ncbi:hypothetical protein BDV95DRAFT_606250 [Massariosphaeria phaeospora]|uniref:Large ribosomal subunit protein bL32m n=1 Tax=Massariosphaeria phaeospora TaxID=100035 RepID=A0A7C8MBE6_9PLEO|nr:hypothetical protein BDV95DRAFT_606250 [Massariosphaeria phaeospora]
MALARPLPPLWQTLLPGLSGPLRPVGNLPLLQRLSQPFRTLPTPFAALAIPALSLPSIPSLADIWEGILKAVPKKKTSYRKKRQRFMAGKGLKDLISLAKCSACGRVKRSHLLCPYCVDAIKTRIFGQLSWSVRKPTVKQEKQLKREERDFARRKRTSAPDPREEKPVLKQTPWNGYKDR